MIDTTFQCDFDCIANAEIPTAAYGITTSWCLKLFNTVYVFVKESIVFIFVYIWSNHALWNIYH